MACGKDVPAGISMLRRPVPMECMNEGESPSERKSPLSLALYNEQRGPWLFRIFSFIIRVGEVADNLGNSNCPLGVASIAMTLIAVVFYSARLCLEKPNLCFRIYNMTSALLIIPTTLP
jgi:hypothetical protein